MAKLHILSDLHLEFCEYKFDADAVMQADVIVLAGDIHLGTKGLTWARAMLPDKEIVYVAGNHEFYGGHWTRTLDELRSAARELGIHFLENDTVTVAGLRFLGCSLWTDFAYFGVDSRGHWMRAAERGLADYQAILTTYNDKTKVLLTAQDTLHRHQASRTWLEQELLKGDPAMTVVVTHHLPHERSVAPCYANDPLTPGFGSRLPLNLMLGARLWIHGHSHESCDYLLGDPENNARVVCNPRGYPRGRHWATMENEAFVSNLVVEMG